jgi:hypothetical protein
MKLISLLVFAFPLAVWANSAPPCFGNGNQELPIIDGQVVQWEHTTPNQFLARAHVAGPIVQTYPDQNGHTHFEIRIGNGPDDLLEVIYNQSFGPTPEPRIGMSVEACGDYITSDAPSGPYPASPAGAIIHWIHANPSGRGHAPGYLIMDGQLCGQGHGEGN